MQAHSTAFQSEVQAVHGRQEIVLLACPIRLPSPDQEPRITVMLQTPRLAIAVITGALRLKAPLIGHLGGRFL
jgi:hypothetical protein